MMQSDEPLKTPAIHRYHIRKGTTQTREIAIIRLIDLLRLNTGLPASAKRGSTTLRFGKGDPSLGAYISMRPHPVNVRSESQVKLDDTLFSNFHIPLTHHAFSTVNIMSTTKIAPVVWINGFPGCGKLTIASIIKTLHSDMILLDNHSLIDPVEAKFQRSHPDYQKERHLYRQHVFKEHVSNPAKLSQLVVFTGKTFIFSTTITPR